ncbi:MAG: SDR family oxidoreductase [Myxococcales bacterium]|nr:SDR family oxidoreductase [Myxococcales bacterium]
MSCRPIAALTSTFWSAPAAGPCRGRAIDGPVCQLPQPGRARGVLITGGGSGIGAALVEAFARQGARVGFVDIAQAPSEALVEGLAGEVATPPFFLPVDVRDIAALQDAVGQVSARFGPIRVLVNNAALDERHCWDELTVAQWDDLQAINLRPHLFTVQAVAETMAMAGGGSIIQLGSNCALLGLTGYPAYVAAKAGIVGLSRALARELGPRQIRVNALVPGWVMTERQIERWLTPKAERALLEAQSLKEKLQPEDIARLALFLAADDSRLITGQAIVIDAGRT